MAHFDIERLGLDEGEEILPGIVLQADGGVTGNFRVLCDGEHDEEVEVAAEEIVEAISHEEIAEPVSVPDGAGDRRRSGRRCSQPGGFCRFLRSGPRDLQTPMDPDQPVGGRSARRGDQPVERDQPVREDQPVGAGNPARSATTAASDVIVGQVETVPGPGAQDRTRNRLEFGHAASRDVTLHRGPEALVRVVELGDAGRGIGAGALGSGDGARLLDAADQLGPPLRITADEADRAV